MKKINGKIKKTLAFMLAASMIFGNADWSVLQVQATENEEIIEEVWEQTSPVETSAISMSMFSLDDGQVELKSTNEVEWIDRLDLSDAQEIRAFYDVLVEAGDNDGVDDYFIDDTYYSSDYSITVATIDLGSDYSNASSIYSAYRPYIIAASNAFDRDHPEVFWLSGKTVTGYSVSYSSGSYKMKMNYKINGTVNYSDGTSEEFDIRDESYRSQALVESAIAEVNTSCEMLMNAAAGKSDADKLRYYNEQLTKTNEYNTSADLSAIDHDCRECTSALRGSIGTAGPVCEGYARAFKVLCDREEIPCVLVDGYALNSTSSVGEAHLWNYVQLDGKWYGADVTWNDPVGGAGGAVSGYESEKWLFVGADTVISGRTFETSHPASNQVSQGGVAFTNGPVLERTAYIADSRKTAKIENIGYEAIYYFTGNTLAEPSEEMFSIVSDGEVSYQWYDGDYSNSALQDSAKIDDEPSVPGTYTLVVNTAETENYKAGELKLKIEICYYDAEIFLLYNGKTELQDVYTEDVVISAEGYQIADENGTFADSYCITEEGKTITKNIRLKSIENGYITDWMKVTVSIDKTAPIILNIISPTEAEGSLTDVSAKVVFTSNESGRFFYVLKKADENAPTSISDFAELNEEGLLSAKTDVFEGELTANSDMSIELTGLDDLTEYILYIMPVDSVGNAENIARAEFTTLKTKVKTVVPTITLNATGLTMTSNADYEVKLTLSLESDNGSEVLYTKSVDANGAWNLSWEEIFSDEYLKNVSENLYFTGFSLIAEGEETSYIMSDKAVLAYPIEMVLTENNFENVLITEYIDKPEYPVMESSYLTENVRFAELYYNYNELEKTAVVRQENPVGDFKIYNLDTSVNEFVKLVIYEEQIGAGGMSIQIKSSDSNTEFTYRTQHTIAYETNGGKIISPLVLTYFSDEEITLPTEVEKEFYLFEGWYTDSELSEETRITVVPEGTEQNLTLYAKYSWAVEFTMEAAEEEIVLGYDEEQNVWVSAPTYMILGSDTENVSPVINYFTEEKDGVNSLVMNIYQNDNFETPYMTVINSCNFTVDKPGNYVVKAVYTHTNYETAELTAQFKVQNGKRNLPLEKEISWGGYSDLQPGLTFGAIKEEIRTNIINSIQSETMTEKELLVVENQIKPFSEIVFETESGKMISDADKIETGTYKVILAIGENECFLDQAEIVLILKYVKANIAEKIIVDLIDEKGETLEPSYENKDYVFAKDDIAARTYTLNATTFNYLGNEYEANLTWKSSNTKVAKVTKLKDGTITLSIPKKAQGVAVVTATAKDDGGAVGTLNLVVVDAGVRLDTTTFSTNSLHTVHSGFTLKLYPNTLKAGVYEETLMPTKAYAEVVNKDGTPIDEQNTIFTYSEWIPEAGRMFFEYAKTPAKSKSYTIYLKVTQEFGSQIFSEIVSFKVTDKQSLPKTSAKLLAGYNNAVYTEEGYAKILITTDKNASANVAPDIDVQSERYLCTAPKEYGIDNKGNYQWLASLKMKDEPGDKKEATISVLYDGYTKPVEVKVKGIKEFSKVPVIGITPYNSKTALFYTDLGQNQVDVMLNVPEYMLNLGEAAVVFEEGELFEIGSTMIKLLGSAKSGLKVVDAKCVEDGIKVTLEAVREIKSASVQFEVSDENYFTGIAKTKALSITAKKIASEKTELLDNVTGKKVTTAVFRKSLAGIECLNVDIKTPLKSTEDIDWTVDYEDTLSGDKNAIAILEQGLLEISFEGNQMSIIPKEEAFVYSKCKLKVIPKYTNEKAELSSLGKGVDITLNFKSGKSEPKTSVTVTTKGKMNLASKDSFIVGVSKFKNLPTGASVIGARFTDMTQNTKYCLKLENGNVRISQLEGVKLPTGKDEVDITFDVQNADGSLSELKTVLKFNLVHTASVKTDVKQIVLYNSAMGKQYGSDITFEETKADGLIEDVKILSDLTSTGISYEKYEASEDGEQLVLHFYVDPLQNRGTEKSYTVKAEVTLKDGGLDKFGEPITQMVSFKINLKK